MEPSQELIDELDRERVRRAARDEPGRKLLAGAELYDLSRSFMLAGIRMQHPDADEQEVRRLARQRLEIGKQNDENDFLFGRYLQSLTQSEGPA